MGFTITRACPHSPNRFSIINFFVFLITFLNFNNSVNATSKYEVRLTFANNKIDFQRPETQLDSGVTFGHKWWVSTFTLETTESDSVAISRRKKNFKYLFQDDLEPYFGKVNAKSKCLIKENSAEIVFMKGIDKDWSNCQNSTEKIAAHRIWGACNGRLWEITLEDSQNDLLNLNCL